MLPSHKRNNICYTSVYIVYALSVRFPVLSSEGGARKVQGVQKYITLYPVRLANWPSNFRELPSNSLRLYQIEKTTGKTLKDFTLWRVSGSQFTQVPQYVDKGVADIIGITHITLHYTTYRWFTIGGLFSLALILDPIFRLGHTGWIRIADNSEGPKIAR